MTLEKSDCVSMACWMSVVRCEGVGFDGEVGVCAEGLMVGSVCAAQAGLEEWHESGNKESAGRPDCISAEAVTP